MTPTLLVLAEDGRGKRTPLSEYPVQGRGGHGVKAAAGPVPLAAALLVTDGDEVVIATSAGRLIRLPAAQVPVQGRRTRGVRLVALRQGERVTTAELVRHDTPEPASGDPPEQMD